MFNSGGNGKGLGFGGFSIQPKKPAGPSPMSFFVPPSSSRTPGNHGHMINIGRKRVKDEEEYFEQEDDDNNEGGMDYLPAPGSPGPTKEHGSGSDSDDPLDLFMENISKEVNKMEHSSDKKAKKEVVEEKGKRDDIELEDDQEAYFRYMEENPNAGAVNDEEEDNIEYDEDGNPTRHEKKMIDPLPPVDHSEINYTEFSKNFYEEHEDIKKLTSDEIQNVRKKLGVKVSGIHAPKPVTSFAHFGFDETMMKMIRKSNFTQPTPIQAQGIPVALSGRDIIGIAKTGSGKTAAYLWPLMVHIMDQKELRPGEGPIGLIIAPTRELSQQIYQEAKKFGKVYNIRVVCAYGGGSLYEQCKACEEGAEIIVATPGRLIELVKKKATNLLRVTYLVFDEADRMFDIGFEPQVRSIANHVRPDRQTLMFSATFRKKVERVARDILTDPIRTIQGDLGEANEDVLQVVKVIYTDSAKWNWLTANLVKFASMGSVLIFVTRKANCEELAQNLKLRDFKLGVIHGDLNQVERNEIITSFKNKHVPILVATDVAARGLDIPHIKTVVNYDVARDIDTHTHRIGRTGRAGQKGTAYTLISTKDKDFAGHLVRNLEGANQTVPKELLDLALQNPWFKKNRFEQKQSKKPNVGGAGLGFKERSHNASHHSHSSDNSISAITSKVSGPQSDRVAAMKQAFQNQFRSNFVSATSSNQQQNADWTSSSGMNANQADGVHDPRSYSMYQQEAQQPSRRKKTRWE